MDPGTYQERLKDGKILVRQAKTRIYSFTIEDVSLAYKETYLNRLLEIRTKVETVTDTRPPDRRSRRNFRIQSCGKKNLVTRLKANEKSVNEEMARLIKENDSQVGASPASMTSHRSVVSSGSGTVLDKEKDQIKVLLRVKTS